MEDKNLQSLTEKLKIKCFPTVLWIVYLSVPDLRIRNPKLPTPGAN
jgi:hypothetical protein